MEKSVEVFLVPEGWHSRYREAYVTVPAATAVAMLGLSDRLEFHVNPPVFAMNVTSRNLDGFRSPKWALAKLDELTAKFLGLQQGYYVLRKTVREIIHLRSAFQVTLGEK